MIRVWCVVLLAIGLGGCPSQRVVTQSQIEVTDVPEYLKSCLARPVPPEGRRTQRDVARFIVRLDERGQDCAAKLKAVVEISQTVRQRVDTFNAAQRAAQ